jgi:hypothetical protein
MRALSLTHPLCSFRLIPLSLSYDAQGRFFVPRDLDHEGLDIVGAASSNNIVTRTLRPLLHCMALPFKFLVRLLGMDRYRATPLFAVLVIIETTDMVFAADSIPAVLSITTDPFIAYTSNIFAVLGLRALYFALAAAMSKFAYLAPALGLILLFIGAKMLLVYVGVHVSIEMTLVVVLGTLAAAVLLSLCSTRRNTPPMGSAAHAPKADAPLSYVTVA